MRQSAGWSDRLVSSGNFWKESLNMWKSSLATLTLLIAAGTAPANIHVTGNGKVSYVPNLGHVNVSVTSDAKTAADAWQKNSAIVQKLFGVLKDFGVDEKDFKTANLHLSPKYAYPKDKAPELIGYTATYDLAITVRKLSQMGTLLDQLVANGANRGMNIAFGTDATEQLLNDARLKAVTDARKKAELYAKGAGANLGQLVSITEGAAMQPQYFRYEHALGAPAAALPIAAGQQELTVQVTVEYAILNN
jgi:uncharacterized protein YggE